MTALNRTAIVVMLDQPFPGWLHRNDPTVYLLAECENEEEARECLKEMCGQILEEQLDGWHRVPSSWPSRRDLHTFDRWFD